jgi:prepilin-type N-terminal cleavage/methylation domain-containing protein
MGRISAYFLLIADWGATLVHIHRAGVSSRLLPAGFTLLELLVVLAMVASTAAIVGPPVSRAVEASRIRAAQRSLVGLIDSLPLRAWRSGVPIEFDADRLRAANEDWPKGWSLSLTRPLQYSPQGVARGGSVEILADGQIVASVQVEPITGKATFRAAK